MRILIIGPYAPHGQVGAIRIISLSRYLKAVGYDVSVLCLSEESLREMDSKGLTASVPEGIRTYTYDITIHCNSALKKNAINEIEFADALKRLLSQEIFDAVIVSAGPFYTFRAFDEIRQKNIPYIVDYRDLNISSADKRKRKGVVNQAKMILSFPSMFKREKECLDGAKFVTVVSPEMGENLASFFHIDRQKIHVVYNGFDDYALRDITRKKATDSRFTVGYFGKLMYYNQELTEKLFGAIEELNQKGSQIRLLHIGPENPAIQQYFLNTGFNSSCWYSCTGQKNYSEGIELLSSCNACTLEYAYPEGPGTKVFDYIFLNKPIIGVTKPGIPLERMLMQFDHAFVCHSQADVCNALNVIQSENISSLIDSEHDQGIINNYSRSKQNEVFRQLLKAVDRG